MIIIMLIITIIIKKNNTIIVTIIKIGLIIMKIIMAMEMQEMITIESIINNTNMEEQHQMQYED